MHDDERLPELLVSFSIQGRSFDPDECSSSIGLRPTRVWTQEREHLQRRTDLATVAWIISTGWEASDSLDESVAALLSTLWPHKSAIVNYVDRHGLSVNVECSVRVWSDDPLYSLSAITMRRLADLGADFSLGRYDYREPALE